MLCHCGSSSRRDSGNLLLVGLVAISILSMLLKELWYEFEAWFNGRVNTEVKHAIRDLQRDGEFVVKEPCVQEPRVQEPRVLQESSTQSDGELVNAETSDE